MGTNQHERDRNASGRQSPPSGHDDIRDDSHALRAGREGSSQRKSELKPEAPTRDAGSDDRRSGSESGKH